MVADSSILAAALLSATLDMFMHICFCPQAVSFGTSIN